MKSINIPVGKHAPVVYYLGTQYGGPIKIGTSENLGTRIAKLRKIQPAAAFILFATEPGGPDLEYQRHRQFRRSYFQGEWYWPTAELLRHIEGL